jgi:cell division protein FtsB
MWASGRFAVLALVLVVLIASYASSLRAWLQQRAEMEAARERIISGEAQVEALTEQAQRWRDPAYVEQQARERLTWVMPGEVGYSVIEEDGTTLGPKAELGQPVSLAEDPTTWYGSLWGTVEEAGKTAAELRAARAPAVSGVLRAPSAKPHNSP